MKYLLTFRPFGRLPEAIQSAYLDGSLHLLPYPGSLVFWGARNVAKLQAGLPLALQIPLLNVITRHEAPHGLRVPQSGWMHEPKPATRSRVTSTAPSATPSAAPTAGPRCSATRTNLP